MRVRPIGRPDIVNMKSQLRDGEAAGKLGEAHYRIFDILPQP
jgi:hypothetical protein